MMGEVNWTAEEFARLMSLPEDHPDRRAAATNPAFDSWARMHSAFTASVGAPLDIAAMAGPRAELSARLERSLGVSLSGTAAPQRAVAASREVRARGGLRGWLATLVVAPGGRLAIGVAAIVLVGAGWWYSARTVGNSGAIRGSSPEGKVSVLAEPVLSHGSIELSWSAAEGADAYQVVLYDPEFSELTRLEPVTETHLTLRQGVSLPAIASGAEVEVEVVALQRGDPISRSQPREIRLP